MNGGEETFRYLDAPQFLKHALGMATQLGDRFSLYYIYFDWPGTKTEKHSQEIERFSALVDSGLQFKAISYQELYSSLKQVGGVDEGYMSYLRARYFSDVA